MNLISDKNKYLLTITILLAFLPPVIWCGPKRHLTDKRSARPQLQGNPRSALINVNNISMWASDNGLMERREPGLTTGVVFPRGTATVVNAGGIVWGGSVRDGLGESRRLRIGGSTFKSGLTPGRIISPGIVEDPQNEDVRIYRIRRNWADADLSRDVSEYLNIPLFDVTDENIADLRALYKKDWIEWPWQKGAPYYERNGIPGYQPDTSASADSAKDEPGLGGADQVVWFVANDIDYNTARSLYGSEPIGIELQVTCWAYDRFEKLQNVIFQRFRVIYKGTATTRSNARIDSMYMAKWADPDIGNFSDDFAGCDVGRSIGYAYNATVADEEFTKYKLTPAVVGYDFLQGPRVPEPGASARWNLSKIDGYKNLPMTSFTYFTSTLRTTDFDFAIQIPGSGSAPEWWNLLRGYSHRPLTPLTCFKDPVTDLCTSFELPGDPEFYEGWVDGLQEPAGDRRFAMVSGPFTLAFGDSQEVVIGLVGAIGTDNRNGVNVMRVYDDAAQDAYNLNFEFPSPVPNPKVRVVELENQFIFDWESDTASLSKVESYRSRGYRFETYTIYQYPLPTSGKDEAVVYKILDPSQPRFVYITEDKLRKRPLVNGQRYYFSVATRAYNPDPSMSERRIESAPSILEVVPHMPDPGTVYPYSIGEVVNGIPNISGLNDAEVQLEVFDPAKADGHEYKILFHRNADPWTDFNEKPKWSLIDSTVNDTLLKQIWVDSPPQRLITRGFSAQVLLPRHGLKGVYQVRYNNEPSREPVFGEPNSDGTVMVVGPGSSTIDTIAGQHPSDHDVELRFNGDSSWSFLRVATGALDSRWVRVPFTCWERRVAGSDTIYRQLYTTIIHEGEDTVWRPSDLLNQTYDGKPLNVFQALVVIIDSVRVGFTYVGGTYHDDVPYRSDMAQYRSYLWLNGQYTSPKVTVSRAYIADVDGDGEPAPLGTVIRFEHIHEIRNGDVKLFRWKEIMRDDLLSAKHEIEKINVFPNPYYGTNRAEINRYQKFVTFSHLTQFATIRIFNLAGILVRTIRKESEGQFIQWDLNNESGLPVAGGLYIAHIQLRDMHNRDLGGKTLKLMIVPENQSTENY